MKSILSYDIICPKPNKFDDFAPLIQAAEKEIENMDKEEEDGDHGDEDEEYMGEYAYQ